MPRLDREVRVKAANATNTRGCNYCHQQRPIEKTKVIVRGHGRKGVICDFCDARRVAAKKRSK